MTEENNKGLNVRVQSLTGASFSLRNKKERKGDNWIATEDLILELNGIRVFTQKDGTHKVMMSALELLTLVKNIYNPHEDAIKQRARVEKDIIDEQNQNLFD